MPRRKYSVNFLRGEQIVMFLADVVVVFATGNITGLNTSATPGPFLLALLAFVLSVISFFFLKTKWEGPGPLGTPPLDLSL